MTMANKKAITEEIADDLLRYVIGIQDLLDYSTANNVAIAVVLGMKDMIAKGISPIEGVGRFPAYLAQAAGKNLRQAGRSGRSRKQNQRQVRASLRTFAQAKKFLGNNNRRTSRFASKRGYPYNVVKKFPDKRPRPVNLFLSGEFLASLEAKVTGHAGSFGIEVGFFTADQAIKEIGHRERANGQPSRPTIPIDREDFAVSIQRAIIKIVEEAIDRGAV
jgi:hypothetical protein